jgi:hypothetical protein
VYFFNNTGIGLSWRQRDGVSGAWGGDGNGDEFIVWMIFLAHKILALYLLLGFRYCLSCLHPFLGWLGTLW